METQEAASEHGTWYNNTMVISILDVLKYILKDVVIHSCVHFSLCNCINYLLQESQNQKNLRETVLYLVHLTPA